MNMPGVTISGPLASTVRVYGDWLPRHILGRFTALCAFVRMIYLAFVVGVLSVLAPSQSWDLTFCDGVSAMIPILRLFCLPVSMVHLSDKTCYLFCVVSFSVPTRAAYLDNAPLLDRCILLAGLVLLPLPGQAAVHGPAVAVQAIVQGAT